MLSPLRPTFEIKAGSAVLFNAAKRAKSIFACSLPIGFSKHIFSANLGVFLSPNLAEFELHPQKIEGECKKNCKKFDNEKECGLESLT